MAWQRGASRAFRYRFRGLIALRDGVPAGALPLFQVPGFPLGSSLISTPLAVYGGVVADDAAAGEALLEAAREMGEARRPLRRARDGMRFDGLPVKDLYVTFRREIGPDHDANFSKIRPKQRTSIRAAQKRGLSWRTGGAELVDRFYPIYSESVRNLGTPVFPKRLFQILMEEHAGESVILLVESDGIPISGVLTFFDGGQALPYYGGTLASAYRYSASDYMYWSPHVPCGRPRLHGLRLRAEQARHRGVPLQAALGVRADAARLSVRAGARSRRPRPEPEEPALLAGHPRLEADPPLDRRRIGPAIVRYFP